MTPLPLTLRLFGPLRILVHGKPLPRLRTRSLEWLLAMLVLRHGRAVDRAWLSGTLWTESEAGQALKNLRNNLSCLRAALGAEAWRIQSPSRDTLTLDLDGADVDLVRFDRGIQAGDEESLRAAVGAYAGPLLEGCYEEWVHPERGSRAAQCLQALEQLAETAQERGNHPEAIAYLQRAELLDPLRDSTARRLIASLDACGNPAAALEVYRRLRNRLHDEMSVAPDPDTTLLFQQIRARARRRPRDQGVRCPDGPAAHPPPPHTPTLPHALPAIRRPTHPLTRLIGREQEVREVGERIAAARLVTLVGAGGVGKTRLAIEVSHSAADDFVHGAAFVELASLSDPALLPAFLAAALGLREEESSREAEALLAVLAGWLSAHNVLLVLDNCEHLLAASAQLSDALLRSCPKLRILASSREGLGIGGDQAYRIPSLSLPDRISDSTL